MTRNHDTHPAIGFGFAAEMRRADLAGFSRWPDRRCLLPRPGRAECEAMLSAPAGRDANAAPMRDAA